MEKKQTSSARGLGKYLAALLFILSGVLLLARNMGWIDVATFNTIVSWQMLLVVLGLFQLLKRSYLGGTILIVVGGCFLLPELGMNWLSVSTSVLIWPVVLIAVGLLFLFKPRTHHGWKHNVRGNFDNNTSQYSSADGFFRSENTFSGVRQVVFDEVFKGGAIRNSFGGTVVDLRRTTLSEGETFIDLECTFGGVEIYMPSDWKVDLRCNTLFGSCEDKRFQHAVIDKSRVLVIRGDVSFGGVEIKS